MTTLALDDFDRVGALGSLWTAYGSGVFLCDGDRAYDSSLPGVEHAATMAVALGAADLYPRKVTVKAVRPALNAGTAEFAILLAPFLNSGSSPPILNVKEVGWRSASGGQIYIRTRTLLPAMVSYTDQLAVSYVWPAGEARTLEAQVLNAGATVQVSVDGVVLGTAPNSTVVTANIAGLYAKRGSVAAGSAPADPIRLDLFKVQDLTAGGFSAEVAPAVTSVGALTSVVLAGEGLIADAVVLPIRNPDKAWRETHRHEVSKRRTGSGHTVRFALSSRRRSRRVFAWSGLTDAELATLRTWLDTTPGPAGIGKYVTPESETLYFALDGAQWEVEPTGPKTRRVTLAVEEVYAA